MDDWLEQKQAFSLHDTATNNPEVEKPTELRRALSPGQLIDHRFRVMRELGLGGAGTVYQVEQVLLKQEFAIKILDPVGVKEDLWRRFQKEAQAAGRLDHAGFVKVHDFGLIDETIPYFTMDLVRGETLAQRIRRSGPLTLKEAIPLFVQLCFALDYAHHRGIIHRDLKPSNISLYEDDITGDIKVKILDFGIAKLVGSDTASLTQAGTVFGTPFYMSPEQCSGQMIDQRSDIYSLGCVFFEALTGAPPFTSANALSLMMQHQNEKPPTLQEASIGEKFPPALEFIIQKMMAKRPEDRYQQFLTTAEDLMAVQQGKSLSAGAAYSKSQGRHADSFSNSAEKVNAFQIYIAIALTAIVGLLVYLVTKMVAQKKEVVPHVSTDFSSFNSVKKTAAEESADRQYFSDVKKVRENAEVRTFHFPTTVSIGKLVYPTGNKVKKIDAIGNGLEILMAPGKPALNLVEVNWATLSGYPQFLAKFRPDEIGMINLGTKSFGRQYVLDDRLFDDVLYYIGSWKCLYSIASLPKGVTDRGIQQLVNLPPLLTFNVSETQVTGPALAKMSNIDKTVILHLDGLKNISEFLPRLKHAPRLQGLHLVADGLNDNDIKNLTNIKTLKRLILRNNPKITDVGLAHLEHLRLARLAIDGCSITPKSISTLKQMHIREKLSIDTSTWSKTDQQKLRAAVSCHVTSYNDETSRLDKEKQDKERAEEVTTDLINKDLGR